ncbi:hypothetical protein GA0115243_103795 [Streptomyces sp. ScaeMP-e83]|nr:hypothetical protein GA0115243_103795 [Streptomyces sp. ScaeMP-e83]
MIREFALSFLPGILQTEAYARAVLGMAFPPLGPAECDKAVVARLKRAKIFQGAKPPVVRAVLDEASLRRPIGGPKVMAEQLDHIIGLTEAKLIRTHVLPMSLGFHSLLESMLTLMWFDDQPPVAYSEGVRVGKLHDSPAVVEALPAASKSRTATPPPSPSATPRSPAGRRSSCPPPGGPPSSPPYGTGPCSPAASEPQQ